MKVNVYMGNEKIKEESLKNYKCVSKIVKEAVDNAYFSYLNENK